MFDWAVGANGTGSDTGYGISALADGSSVVTGSFYGNTSFGSITLTSAGDDDVFVAKLAPSGAWEWALSAGGTDDERGYGISSLADGSSVVTGYFSYMASFGSISLTSAGGQDIFVAKVTSSGAWEWALSAGGTDVFGTDISALADGSSVVNGS
jgi:hypothetical protein